jgi:uncharacterized protein YdeI (YjbR/CyaY-like superfamily)
MNPKVSFYFEKADNWQQEIKKLRSIVLELGLEEVLKWGCPCYTYDGKNVVLIHIFKEYCAILFFKGANIKDPHNLLIQQTENVQAARQIRFTSLEEINDKVDFIKAYIQEAIAVEKSGLKVELKKSTELAYPEEFQKVLDGMPNLKAAFEALTPGRQRAYILHFSAPKQAKTTEARIQNSIPKIFEGKGLNDK